MASSIREHTMPMDLLNFAFRQLENPALNARGAGLNNLGPLADLPGKWTGKGFNQIWRPHFAVVPPDPPGQDRFLELNLTTETLEFEQIPGPIPNRGFLQGDISMFGVTYMQKVSDVVSGGIHVEPGIWASIPPTTDPA